MNKKAVMLVFFMMFLGNWVAVCVGQADRTQQIGQRLEELERKMDVNPEVPRLTTNCTIKECLQAMTALPVYFLQIGANDGISFSDFYDYVQAGGDQWRGVMVEPTPVFAKLRANMAHLAPRVQLEQCAITKGGQDTEFATMLDDEGNLPPGQPEWALGVSTADLSRNDLSKLNQTLVRRIQVKGCTMAQLIKRHRFPRLDLLFIDAEGYDMEILLNEWDDVVLHYRPRVIVFEYWENPDKVFLTKLFSNLSILAKLAGYHVKQQFPDCVMVDTRHIDQ